MCGDAPRLVGERSGILETKMVDEFQVPSISKFPVCSVILLLNRIKQQSIRVGQQPCLSVAPFLPDLRPSVRSSCL